MIKYLAVVGLVVSAVASAQVLPPVPYQGPGPVPVPPPILGKGGQVKGGQIKGGQIKGGQGKF